MAKRKSHPGSIYAPRGTQRLYLKYKGVRVTTGLVDTKQNRQFAEQWIWDLYRIHHGMKPVLLQPDGTMPHADPVTGAIQGQPLSLQARVSAEGQLVYIVQNTEPQTNAQVMAQYSLRTNDNQPGTATTVDTSPTIPVDDNKAVTSLRHKDVWDEYVSYNQARDLDDRTRTDYKRIVEKVITNVDHVISRLDIERQVAVWKKQESHLGSTSVNIYLRSFSLYCNYLRDRDLLDKSVNLKQFRMKGKKPKNEMYEEHEYRKVIAHFDTHVPANGDVTPYRQISRLLRWFLASGFRIKETLLLYRSNFNLRFGRIEVPNKRTKNVEYFPITDEIRAILDEIPKDQDKLFTWQYSSKSSVLRMIKKGFEAVGLKARKGFHTFRKTFADELYLKNVDMYDRKQLLRHANIKTTADSYSYTENDRLSGVLKKAKKKKSQATARSSARTNRTPAAATPQGKRSRAKTRSASAATKAAVTAKKTQATDRRTQTTAKEPRQSR